MWGHKPGIDLLDTPEMNRFFIRLDRLDEGQILALGAAWHGITEARHESAWTMVRALAEREELTNEIDRVRGAALAWTSRATTIAQYAVDGRPVSMWAQIKIEASEAVVDAALAIALGTSLDGAAYDVLIGPWLAVTEDAG
jgi:hypothetical protein